MLRHAVKDEVVKEFDRLADEVLGALKLPLGGHQ
jgi:chromosome partitioning protein